MFHGVKHCSRHLVLTGDAMCRATSQLQCGTGWHRRDGAGVLLRALSRQAPSASLTPGRGRPLSSVSPSPRTARRTPRCSAVAGTTDHEGQGPAGQRRADPPPAVPCPGTAARSRSVSGHHGAAAGGAVTALPGAFRACNAGRESGADPGWDDERRAALNRREFGQCRLRSHGLVLAPRSADARAHSVLHVGAPGSHVVTLQPARGAELPHSGPGLRPGGWRAPLPVGGDLFGQRRRAAHGRSRGGAHPAAVGEATGLGPASR